jgi:uncharacterized protein YndB with AHSA1/START domain
MNTKPFVIEKTLNARPEIVWKAISNKEKMKHWYFDLPSFEPVPGLNLNLMRRKRKRIPAQMQSG